MSKAIHTDELSDEEALNLDIFLAEERLGLDDVAVWREDGGIAVVTYNFGSGQHPHAEFDLTNGLDL